MKDKCESVEYGILWAISMSNGGAMMRAYKCPMCGGSLEIDDGDDIVKCPYCCTSIDVDADETERIYAVYTDAVSESSEAVINSHENCVEKAPNASKTIKVKSSYSTKIVVWSFIIAFIIVCVRNL